MTEVGLRRPLSSRGSRGHDADFGLNDRCNKRLADRPADAWQYLSDQQRRLATIRNAADAALDCLDGARPYQRRRVSDWHGLALQLGGLPSDRPLDIHAARGCAGRFVRPASVPNARKRPSGVGIRPVNACSRSEHVRQRQPSTPGLLLSGRSSYRSRPTRRPGHLDRGAMQCSVFEKTSDFDSC